jgi:protein disulfide-isomerase
LQILHNSLRVFQKGELSKNI